MEQNKFLLLEGGTGKDWASECEDKRIMIQLKKGGKKVCIMPHINFTDELSMSPLADGAEL